MKKIKLSLSLGRTLVIDTRTKNTTYQLGPICTNDLRDIFFSIDKHAFIANYSTEYKVLFVYAPIYFSAWKRSKFLHFNVLDNTSRVIFKTELVQDLVAFLE